MNNSKAVFDATASSYDRSRAAMLPGCDSFFRWALELIPPTARRIVDLGAGTGMFTAMLRDKFPAAEIFAIDFSAPMLELARQRLGEDARVHLIQADYTLETFPERVDAIVSSLSIHHLDDDKKKLVFQRAFAALPHGGVFVNAEQVLGPTPEIEARYKTIWLAQVRALGATEEMINDALFRMQEDRCVSVETQLGWMRKAGFADADCWFKENRLAVMSGSKA